MASDALDFRPIASIGDLQKRSEIISAIRHFFDSRGFFHVETPLLSRETVVDRHLHPIPVAANQVLAGTTESAPPFWLQTSPEFAMKRLLAAGATSIYQIGKAFRQAERGAIHNPEFTMLEWYRVGDDQQAGMDLLASLVESILQRPPTVRMSYAEAFATFASLEIEQSTVDQLRDFCKSRGMDVTAFEQSKERDVWLNLILCSVIEPALAASPEPKMIYDWPPSQSALAIVRPGKDGQADVAERFEIYVDGVELANGYHELLDPNELVRRTRINNDQRESDGQQRLPENSRLLAAMKSGLPACAGVALGVDRLVMLALEFDSIDDVTAFPVELA